jgi:hypothetical protein
LHFYDRRNRKDRVEDHRGRITAGRRITPRRRITAGRRITTTTTATNSTGRRQDVFGRLGSTDGVNFALGCATVRVQTAVDRVALAMIALTAGELTCIQTGV